MSNISTSPNQIQVESVQYQAPVSESALSSMGAAINYTLLNAPPLGTIVPNTLTQSQVNALVGPGYWLLANGQSCVGTRYAAVTGASNVPDVSQAFLPVGPWRYFTPSGSAAGTAISYSGAYRQVGSSVEVVCGFTVVDGTYNSPSSIRFNLPPGLVINSGIIPVQGFYTVGQARWVEFNFLVGSREYQGFVTYNVGEQSVKVVGYVQNQTPNQDLVREIPGNTFTPTPGVTQYMNVTFSIGPIVNLGLVTNYYIRVN